MQNLNEFIKNERKRKKVLDNKKRSLTTANYWTDDPYQILKEELEKRRAKYSILSKSPYQHPRVQRDTSYDEEPAVVVQPVNLRK